MKTTLSRWRTTIELSTRYALMYRPPSMAIGMTTRSRGVIWVGRVTRKKMPCLSSRVYQSLEPKCGSEGPAFRLVWTGACAG